MNEEARQKIQKAEVSKALELDLSNMDLQWLGPEIGQVKTLERLILDKNGLTELPEDIVFLENLRSLELNNNQLRHLPKGLSRLTKLKAIGLTSNALTEIDDEFCELSNLSSVGLDNNHIHALPGAMGQLRNLESIGLSNNRLENLPSSIGQLGELAELELSGNNLEVFPKGLAKLRRLKSLWLGFNRLTSIPPEIGRLTALTSLHLEGNHIEGLPAEIGRLKSLEELDLSNNSLTALPDDVRKLTNLEKLYLDGNSLGTLPPKFGSLRRLKELSIDRNELRSLPKGLGELSQLERLRASGNQLNELAPEIGKLSELRELALDANRLTVAPDVSGLLKLEELSLSENSLSGFNAKLNRLTSLVYLNLGKNRITAFPAGISWLVNLRHLDLSLNLLRSVPSSVRGLRQLKTLDLSRNRIDDAGNGLGSLKSLETLLLSGNKLSKLPKGVGNLKNLKILMIDANSLTEVPDSLRRMKSLRILQASENQINSLPGNLRKVRLRELFLANNNLRQLPPSIGHLRSLSVLDLSNNPLGTLPAEIGQLSSLERLIINQDKKEGVTEVLHELPREIGSLKRLRMLSVKGNQLRSVPEELVDLRHLSDLHLDNNDIISLPKFGVHLELTHFSCSGNRLQNSSDPRSEAWVAWLEERNYKTGSRFRARSRAGMFDRLPKSRRPGFPSLAIKRLRLVNIKSFKELDITFDSDFTLLLGDNASGKTTVIKGIAIATIGPDLANQLEPSPADYLKKGEDRGLIEAQFGLRFDEEFDPATFSVGVSISAGKKRFEAAAISDMLPGTSANSASGVNWLRAKEGSTFGFSCAYGSTRFLPNNRHGILNEDPDVERARFLPLFETGRPMIDPAVLKNILSGNLSNLAAAPRRALGSDILNEIEARLGALIRGMEALDKEGGLRFPHGSYDVGQLSEGFAIQLGLITHLIRHLLEVSEWRRGLFDIFGLVLIDEVDLHLHPQWQETVVSDLSESFPNMQFIVSSHSVLVTASVPSEKIRHLAEGRITKRIEKGGLRTDQIYRTEYFGVKSTRHGPSFARILDEYDVLSNKSDRTVAEERRLDELRKLIDRIHDMETEQERMRMLEREQEEMRSLVEALRESGDAELLEEILREVDTPSGR